MSDQGSVGSAVAAREVQVSRESARLSAILTELKSAVDSLEGQLKPVLTETPSPGEDPKPEEALVPLAEDLFRKSELATEITWQVHSIQQRLEL